jgi:chemotaxis protein MotB
MNFMVEKGGLPPDKFSIQAYGEYMPKYDNSTEEGRTKNRRVEIIILKGVDNTKNTY